MFWIIFLQNPVISTISLSRHFYYKLPYTLVGCFVLRNFGAIFSYYLYINYHAILYANPSWMLSSYKIQSYHHLFPQNFNMNWERRLWVKAVNLPYTLAEKQLCALAVCFFLRNFGVIFLYDFYMNYHNIGVTTTNYNI